MKQRAAWVLAGSLGVLALSLGLAGVVLLNEPWVPRLRLGKTRYTLAGVTYGTNHSLPDWRWTAHLPWSRPSPPTSSVLSTATPMPVVWVHSSTKGEPNPIRAYHRLTDRHGCVFPFPEMSGWHVLSNGGGMAVFFPVPNRPRRDGSFNITFFDNRTSRQLGSLMARDPDPQAYPEWTAEPFPIVRRMGKLELALTEIVHLPAGASETAGLRLRITESGQPSSAWRPARVLVSDATGNSTSQPVRNAPDEGLVRFPGLCFRESAWKLEVQIAPRFPPAVAPKWTWTVPELPNAQPRQTAASNQSISRDGVVLRILSVRHPQWARDPDDRQVQFRVQSAAPCLAVLFDARDEQGRALLPAGGGTERELSALHPGGFQASAFLLHGAGRAKRLRLKIAVYPVLTATYLAKPGP